MPLAPRDYAAALAQATVGKDAESVGEAVARFVQVMRRRGLASLLPQVLAALARLPALGRQAVRVESAHPLTGKESAAAVRALGLSLEDVTLTSVVNPDLLGGVRVATGDRVLDATVSRRLADLGRRLKA